MMNTVKLFVSYASLYAIKLVRIFVDLSIFVLIFKSHLVIISSLCYVSS